MYEFQCGSPVCHSHFSAPSKDELMGQVARHVATKHRVAAPSKSLVAFVEANCTSEVTTTAKRGG
jgi:predicted small metal-binding protein